ncbi:MAG: hypothetical protein ACPLTQ_10475, partial [Anaerolineae bacterium]
MDDAGIAPTSARNALRDDCLPVPIPISGNEVPCPASRFSCFHPYRTANGHRYPFSSFAFPLTDPGSGEN